MINGVQFLHWRFTGSHSDTWWGSVSPGAQLHTMVALTVIFV